MNTRELKKNAFWIGSGVALLVLVAIYFLMVSPKHQEVEKLTKNIQNISMELGQVRTGRPDVDTMKKHIKETYDQISGTVGYYQGIDTDFEGWFEDLGARPGDPVNPGNFLSNHFDRQGTMDKDDLAFNKDQAEKFTGWRDVKSSHVAAVPDAQALLKDMQKMYWIRKRFANSVAHLVKREESVEWDRKSFKSLQLCWWKDIYERHPQRPQGEPLAPKDDFLSDVPRGWQGYVLPGDLGSAYIFYAKFEIYIHELPKVLSKFLTVESPDQHPPMLVELVALKIQPSDTAEYTSELRVPAQMDPEDQDKKAMEKMRQQKPIPVNVWLTARVLDVDSKKLGELTQKVEKFAKVGQ